MRRCSARRRGPGNVVSALDFVLPRKREAAGAKMASGELQATSDASICGDSDQYRGLGECVRAIMRG
jgi:hypothetical protein